MGCKDRIASGITWAFEHVEELIILEDDCVPDLSFFRFCREVLDKYRDDNRIFYVVGSNHDHCEPFSESYAFSRRLNIWGWATWKRAWNNFDITTNLWDKLKQDKYFKNILRKYDRIRLTKEYQSAYEGKIDTWDYMWSVVCFANNALHVVPKVNLVRNIGFELGGTHVAYPTIDHLYIDEAIDFPLTHPDIMSPLNRLFKPPTVPEKPAEQAEYQKKLEAILTDYDGMFKEFLRLGQYHAVKILFKKLLRDDRLPRLLTQYHLNFSHYVALAYFNLGDYEHTEALINILLAFSPRNVDLLLFRANTFVHRNDLGKAHEIFKTLTALNVTDGRQKAEIARLDQTLSKGRFCRY